MTDAPDPVLLGHEPKRPGRNRRRGFPFGRRGLTRLVTPGLFVLFGSGSLVGPARAQEEIRRGDLVVGLDLGWTGFGSELVKPNGTRLSLYGAYSVTHGIALVADISCLGGSERAPADSLNFTMCTGSVGGSLDLTVHPNLVPYVRLSVGQTQLDRGARMGVFEIEERSAAVQAGAGTRFHFRNRKRVSVRADVLWTRARVFEGWSTHTSVALGVAYRIAPGN